MLKQLTTEGMAECDLFTVVDGKNWAFVPVVAKSEGFGLGIAVENEPGYHPVPVFWCNGDSYDEMAQHADELNRDILLIGQKRAAEIVMSSMRRPAGEVEAFKYGGFSVYLVPPEKGDTERRYSYRWQEDEADDIKEVKAQIDYFNASDTDPENIYRLPGVQQSIEEDRK